MPYFRYKALDLEGHSYKAHLFAKHRKEAMEQLGQIYPIILSLETEPSWWRAFQNSHSLLYSDRELSLFCKHLSFLTEGGIALVQSLELILQETKDAHKRFFLRRFIQSLEAGESLSEALSHHPRLPDFFIASMKAGEQGARLGPLFRDIAEYYQKLATAKQRRQTSTLYPILLLFVSMGVAYFILSVILPNFLLLYDQNVALPLPTRILLRCYEYRMALLLIPLLIMVFAFLMKYYLFITLPTLRISLDKWKLHSFLWSGYTVKQDLTRWSSPLSILLGYGLELQEVLPICANLIENTYLKQEFSKISGQLEQGSSFHEVIRKIECLPVTFIRMLHTGEQGNRLSSALTDHVVLYENDIQQSQQKMQRLLEPVLILFLSLLVGFLAAAILLPMMNQWQGDTLFL